MAFRILLGVESNVKLYAITLLPKGIESQEGLCKIVQLAAWMGYMIKVDHTSRENDEERFNSEITAAKLEGDACREHTLTDTKAKSRRTRRYGWSDATCTPKTHVMFGLNYEEALSQLDQSFMFYCRQKFLSELDSAGMTDRSGKSGSPLGVLRSFLFS